MDWTSHYPAFTTSDEASGKQQMTADVEIADIGCGFGGLIVALSPVYPNTLMLGGLF
jgi:tRNA (guanine-N7-)-methyltransferase